MKRGVRSKKAVAWVILLIFLFTCIMPSGTVLAAANDQQIENTGGISSNADVEISKIITGTDKENYFDITLTVKTSETIEELAQTQKTDVVIVMDISNTMNSNKRIDNAKSAAQQFVEDFTSAMGSSGRIGIVTFNRDAKNIQGFTSNVTTLKNKIKNITAPSDTQVKWTNIEGGLQLAANMLDSSTAPHKYIILLTDGFPTTYIKSGASSTSTITGYYPSTSSGTVGADGVFYNQELKKWCYAGTDYSDKGATRAQNAAAAIKNSGINIFSVGIDIGGQTIQGYLDTHKGKSFSTVDTDSNKNSYVIGSASDANAYKNWLGNKIAGGPDLSASSAVRYSDGSNLTALKTAYAKIFEEIKAINQKAIADEWIAADPMGADIEFLYFYDKSGAIAGSSLIGSHAKNAEDTAAYSNGKISWTLLKSGYTTSKDGNTTYYNYDLKYRVRLENENTGFVEYTDKVTNGTTTLKYKVNTNGSLSNEKSLEFQIPAVEGYLTNLEFTKIDALTGAGLAGATFTLTHNSNCSVCDDVAIAKQTKTSGADGKVTFTNIPSGHEYTLKETKAPAGYEVVAKEYKVNVAYDKLEITNSDAAFDGTAFTNKSTETSVKVEKVWEDGDNQDGIRPETIQVQLKADNVAQGEPVTLSATNSWQHTWTGLAVYKNGEPVSYTVEELDVPEGYTVKLTGDAVHGYVITNNYAPEVTWVEGTKYWVDNNNEAGKRPGEITVNLLADGEVIASAVVDGDAKADSWNYKFENLPKYSANGKAIVYTVEEEAAAGYTTKIEGYNIINTIEQKYFDISGTKTWIAPEGTEYPEIVIDLFRDGEKFDEVTLAPGTVEYKFENLESYDLTDGHMYQYQLAERKVTNYVPSYEMNVNGKDRIIDITNTYSGEEEFVTISGEKKWVAPEGTVLPTSVTLQLYQNGNAMHEAEVTAEMNWQYSFDNLPMYDEDGTAYSYTVKEVPVDGYLSLVVPTANGYDITNTLYVGEAGQFSVSKVVSGGDQMLPNADTEYGFVLNVKATINQWDSMKVYQKSELEDARDKALEKLDAANEELARAERLFRQNAVAFTTGSAYQFIMVEEVYVEEPEVTTGSAYDYTTGSVYKYTIVDNDGDILVKQNKTSLFTNLKPAADAADAITRVIDAIKALADEFKNLNKASVFLKMLSEEQQSSTPSALKFDRTAAEELLQAEREVQKADALVAAGEQAIDDFMNAEVTTPSAIKITMTPTAGSGLEAKVLELDTDSALYDEETMSYVIDFGLLKDTGYVFTIEAADKAVIEYSISENALGFDTYKGTEITVNGTEKLNGRYVALRTLDKASADTFLFNNIYADNPEDPYVPPTDPEDPYVPPTDPDDPYVPPTDPDDPYVPPTDPDDPPYVPPYVPPVIPEEPPVVPGEPVVIEEPDVPLADNPVVEIPGEIIDEEDIPLGDAPPTGDNANAVPFMMMMVLAAAGLVVTRRRFNET